MQYLEHTSNTPYENLACDEVLLHLCERDEAKGVLRFWESPTYFVVVGYSNKVTTEVREAACRDRNVPVTRRLSGGGTVVQGPGCLNYSIILKINEASELKSLRATNCFFMKRLRDAFQPFCSSKIEIEGHTDLAINGLKFSGNAQRRGRTTVLFHGTILYDFDLSIIEDFLPMPSMEPPYRNRRKHTEFLTNFPRKPEEIKAALKKLWNAEVELGNLDPEKVIKLSREKYAALDWIYKF